MTSHWTPAAVVAIARAPLPAPPPIAPVPPLLPGVDLWDYWPVQEADGRVARVGGGTLFIFLAAPAIGDPDARHAHAALRLLHRAGDGWRDLGPLFPAGLAPGSRQWSGSTVVSPGHDALTLYFTAAGRRGEAAVSYEQRLFASAASLSDTPLAIGPWSPPVELASPGPPYMTDMTGGGALGTIKAFRDPAFFRDPVGGDEYLLFTASLESSASPWNGTVGLARKRGDAWHLAPPLISADGVNNELERPHVVVKDGRYYCFWSTQAKVFAASLVAPTGLYGMVAERFHGPWTPLNGTGLVIANPRIAPHQAYSWLVLADGHVLSFADLVGLPGPPPTDTAAARRAFGGTPAPELRLALAGDSATLLA